MVKKEIKVYNIGFVGAFDSTRRNVRAYSAKEAKGFFCAVFGGSVGYAIARHHDSTSLNDHRHCIDWYDAECGQEAIKKDDGRSVLLMAGLINLGESVIRS